MFTRATRAQRHAVPPLVSPLPPSSLSLPLARFLLGARTSNHGAASRTPTPCKSPLLLAWIRPHRHSVRTTRPPPRCAHHTQSDRAGEPPVACMFAESPRSRSIERRPRCVDPSCRLFIFLLLQLLAVLLQCLRAAPAPRLAVAATMGSVGSPRRIPAYLSPRPWAAPAPLLV